MKAGRSRASVLVLARRSLHVFVWSPWTGADSTGGCVRCRSDGEVWTHWRLIVMQRNASNLSRLRGLSPKRVARGDRVLVRRTLTVFELSRWQTVGGTSEKKRVGTKGYVRLKLAWPGRALRAELTTRKGGTANGS